MRMVGLDIFARPEPIRNCKVWRENWPSVMFFERYCSTQWRYVAGATALAATGLDHTAVLADLRILRLLRTEHDRIYRDVLVMERAALAEMASQRK